MHPAPPALHAKIRTAFGRLPAAKRESSVVKPALAMLSSRYRPGRTFTSRSYIEGFLRLKLSGRRNEIFGGRGRRFKSSHPDQ